MHTEVNPGEPTVLEEFQIRYLLDETSRFKISNKTRQAGGSLVVAMAKFWKCYRNEATDCDIVSINRAEAQGKITYVYNLWESLPKRWRHPLSTKTTEQIAFHGSGRSRSRIRSIAASAGVRGGKKDIVFDEAHFIPNFETLFVGALPATVRNSGGFDAVSTPNGQQGRFFTIWADPEHKYTDWTRYSFVWLDVTTFCTDIHEARRVFEEEFHSNVDALVNGGELYEAFASEALKKIADSFTAEEFLQEFCGKFVDESTAFYPYVIIDKCRKHSEAQPTPEGGLDRVNVLSQWVDRPDGNDNSITIGIDFAEGKKGGDSTSIQVVEHTENRSMLRFSMDLNHSNGFDDFDAQLHEINSIIAKFKPSQVTVDETGLGRKIAADLKKVHGSLIQAITFTNQNKEEMALNLKHMLEKESLWLPWDNKPLRMQIHNVKRKIMPTGSIHYSGEPHDDMFWALALACKGKSKRGFRIIALGPDMAFREI